MAPFPLESALAIGLGANISSCHGPPESTLRWLAPRLSDLLLDWGDGDAQDVRCSAFLQTQPIGGPPGQAPYFNAVLLLTRVRRPLSERAALELLDHLQRLEQDCGRDRAREQRWGPRPLDLDLLFWGEMRLDHPRLVLPHPRMHLRRFVLEPLLQAMQATNPPCW
ncbi:2-amino-4-hydroxy-6-hydroxymethyldihydropteridine pyrophosphokinase [Synechococcus sp. KORDI-52]|uniref:2-amino-4-hydroxy-6- hydroxymethyldihydropteridine diphosphokinase n=1 Tax=Synechococcus sp. KORDI-52 TaxID=585425 RepID=UPI0004E07932|nr:2-amino-4-hydroxy-6-hydroxymethyldihydropteridine diphosphokinase [Synechococcus sp. KORDI-52]AII47826.1 2-amino-4-hydroxy-6-hydroxymethyldihydropteridine pyrophosphokinase [Synechococcus sp. KORDI-52]